MTLARRAILVGVAGSLTGCVTTPRTQPLAQAVSAKGLEVVGALDAVFEDLGQSPDRFNRLSCQHQILSLCNTTPRRLLESTRESLCGTATIQEGHDAYRTLIRKMRVALGPLRRAYTQYGELASINAEQQTADAAKGIVDSLNAALAALGTRQIEMTPPVAGGIGLLGMFAAEAHGRRLRALNADFAAYHRRVLAWWTEDMDDVLDSARNDFTNFTVGDTALSCIAPLPQSEALPFTNENVRRAMRREQMVAAELDAAAKHDEKRRAVASALDHLGRAHVALAQDVPSVTEALARMTAAVEHLSSVLED